MQPKVSAPVVGAAAENTLIQFPFEMINYIETKTSLYSADIGILKTNK